MKKTDSIGDQKVAVKFFNSKFKSTGLKEQVI